MLITPYTVKQEDMNEVDLKQCGILKCSRKLIFFVDRTEFMMGTCRNGKAIQINLSVDVDKDSSTIRGIGLSNNLNGTNLKNSVYKYDVVFPFGTEDLRGAVMWLVDAYSVEETNDFDNKVVYKNDIGKYNREMCAIDGKIETLNPYRNTIITLPLYYNELHQSISEGGKIPSIIWMQNKIQYEAHELIDRHTVIEVHDIKTYDTLIQTLIGQIQYKSSNRSELNSVNFISDCFVVTAESMLNGYSFIYDTEMGVNVKTIPGITSVPYSQFRIKENLISNLSMLKDFVVQEAKLIEKKHGSIRLYYVPLMSGDKLDIKFKDYSPDKQPDFNQTKLDKGYSIEENLVEDYQEVLRQYTDEGADF